MRHKNKGELVDAVAGELQKLLDDPHAIDPALIRTGDERYSRTLLYRDPRQRFIVALLTWKPGQQSPIHDHECWGTVGVYRGALTEVRYDRDGRALTAGPAETFDNGAISKMKPPEPDLHTMGNQTDDLTVTVHVYGRDMRDANVYDPETGAPERKAISFDYFGPLASE